MKNDGIIVFGSSGLLGSHVFAILEASKAHQRVFGLSSNNVDFQQKGAAAQIIKTILPAVVINCAAWADVDACEADPAKADAINVRAVHEMAMMCRDTGSRLVHISTDFVYSGREEAKPPYREIDLPSNLIGRDPSCVYAKSKYSGEVFAEFAPDHCIIRTSWLFGNHPRGKKTFPEWFLDNTLATIQQMRAAEQSGASYKKMPLLTDRFGSPSYAPDVAQAIVILAASRYVGPAHVVNRSPEGFNGSQEEFGTIAIDAFANSHPLKTGLMSEIARDFDKIFVRQTQADLIESGAWKVARPTDTRLAPAILGGFNMRSFEEALTHFWKTRTIRL